MNFVRLKKLIYFDELTFVSLYVLTGKIIYTLLILYVLLYCRNLVSYLINSFTTLLINTSYTLLIKTRTFKI